MATMMSSRNATALKPSLSPRRSVVGRSALRVRAQAGTNGTALNAVATYVSTAPVPTKEAPTEFPLTVNVTGPEQVLGVLSAPQTYANLVKAGVKKAETPAAQLFVSGILAGAFIAVGAFLACTVTGGMQSLVPTLPGIVKLVGGLIFPVGLTMVVIGGVELYTGNTAVIPMAMYEGKANIGGLARNWFWSYFGNFVGSLLMVAAVSATGLLVGNVVPVNMAVMKTTLPFSVVLARSTICNWLVCMAVWNAASATTLPGKMMGLWGPIATFVTIGLEHSVANMFFIPMGIVLGAKVTFSEFLLNNLLPVTLGNTLGGLIFVGTAFAYLHGNLGKAKPAAA